MNRCSLFFPILGVSRPATLLAVPFRAREPKIYKFRSDGPCGDVYSMKRTHSDELGFRAFLLQAFCAARELQRSLDSRPADFMLICFWRLRLGASSARVVAVQRPMRHRESLRTSRQQECPGETSVFACIVGKRVHRPFGSNRRKDGTFPVGGITTGP